MARAKNSTTCSDRIRQAAEILADSSTEVDRHARLIAAAPRMRETTAALLTALEGLNHKRLDGKEGYCVCPFRDGSDFERHSASCRVAQLAITDARAILRDMDGQS